MEHPYTVLDNLEKEASRVDKALKHANAYCKKLTDILNENNIQKEYVSIDMKSEEVGSNGFIRHTSMSWDGEFDPDKPNRKSKIIISIFLKDKNGKDENFEAMYFEDLFDEDKIKYTKYLYIIASKLLETLKSRKLEECEQGEKHRL